MSKYSVNKYTSKATNAQKKGDAANNSYSSMSNKSAFDRKKVEGKLTEAIAGYSCAAKEWREASRYEIEGAKQENEDVIARGRRRNSKLYEGYANENKKKADKLRKIGENKYDMPSTPSGKTPSWLESLAQDGFAFAIFSVIAFSFALAFSTFSVTGLVIGDTFSTPINYITFILFIIGLIFAGVYLRKGIKKTKIVSKKNSEKKKK